MDPLIEKGIYYLEAARLLVSQKLYEQASIMVFYGIPYLIKGIVRDKTKSYIYTRDVNSMLNFIGRRAEYSQIIKSFVSRNKEKMEELLLLKRYLNYDVIDGITKEKAEMFLTLYEDAVNLCKDLGSCN
ncbi:HEPN domain-containing protein [Sulfuracidifex tepidarius]|uniref:HEPN domain-containing protein n=1 Tax=Sulfuracidifex tepidarius TaxID=1294262 RepID=A0A510E2D5_9CREN|nr:HEPN domain-containing protein [Sulfuracidifex tepidarius]BBG26652.1 hypothetical protein IC007_1169 [Sulfuracidifex tepidarius]